MKTAKRTAGLPALALATALMMCGGTTAAFAAPTPLRPQIVFRPLTPGDITLYGLPATTEVSGGLHTVGVGMPIYIELEITNIFPLSNIVSVTWALTGAPATSHAALQASPLGTNIPIYEPTDRSVMQVAGAAGRTLLRPDQRGQYIVSVTVNTTTVGSTNLTATITAGVYMGVNTCALCHSGGLVAPEKVQPWENTAHATMFTRGIDGDLGFYSMSCVPCHTVGFDQNTNAVNGGFDDVMLQTGWQFPATLSPTNWAAVPAALQNVANIQCENCHGPGSEHAYSLGDTNLITITVNSGACNQCHDAPTHHVKGTEWYVSGHANMTRIPSGTGRDYCVRCHTSDGFIGFIGGAATTNTAYSAVGCQACHEPHGQTMPTNNPHLIRTMASVTMGDGTVVTNAGEGLLCLECHHSRNGSAVTNVANYPLGLPTWPGGSSFGPHDGPQGDMIMGINAITYGKNIPSSAHRQAITNLCVTCHMQATASTDPGFLVAGGHTFHMEGTNSSGTVVQMTAACAQCHGNVSTFDLVREDYNGDGVIEGVQEEVQHLLDQLSTLLPNSSGVIDGTVKSSLSVKTNWTKAQLNAAYNWQFVSNDGSKGIHNIPFAVGVLKASIADLTGISVAGGLPDAWVLQYFGSTTNVNAAPNACPAGDGIPNWLKYALGLNPLVAGAQIPGGVVWDDDGLIGGGTNSIQIFTAAEVAFNTQVGVSYQIQAISSLSGTWQNVGNPIAGTGSSISYLTPTRHNAQQFYRVLHTP